MQKYEGLHKIRISLQLKNKWTNVNIFLNNIFHQLTITWGWMCPQNKKSPQLVPIISTAERPWSSQHQRELKVLLLSFYQKVQHSTFGSPWMDGHLGKYESISTNLNVLPIYCLLSSISKNLVIAALKGKTSMVLSPQNWQLDTPEGKDWYINV